jgi:2-haloacid dehalogenase
VFTSDLGRAVETANIAFSGSSAGGVRPAPSCFSFWDTVRGWRAWCRPSNLCNVVAALMLDFYGTVVHEDDSVISAICEQVASEATSGVSVGDIAQQWARLFAQECAGSFGDTFKSQRAVVRATLVRVLESVGSPADPDQLTRAQFDHWRRPPLFEDAREFLARIDIPMCIVSNIDRADLEAALDYHDLAFDYVVTSEDVKSYKPRPELFERAIDLLGAPSHALLHVGDSLSSDVMGANALAVPVAWINRFGRHRPAEASLWAEVENLIELADPVQRA